MRNVAYVPYSADLSHPGDRRRIKVWSDVYDFPINAESIEEDDLLVLSAASSMRKLARDHNGPVVVDLVDGYLSYKPSWFEDLSRNLVRSSLGNSSFGSITFSRELRKALSAADAVIVSCPEQAENVKKLNRNTFCILDDHSELENLESNSCNNENNFTVLWEGLGYTLKHLITIAEELERFVLNTGAKFIVVTNPSFKQYGGRIRRVDASAHLRRVFKNIFNNFEFIEWSVKNLSDAGKRASVAIIPINSKDKFALAKPENKLLSFWKMGIPTLCSPTPAYNRVLTAIGHQNCLVSDSNWLDSLNAYYQRYVSNPNLLETWRGSYRAYLAEFHTNEKLARKWDEILRPLL